MRKETLCCTESEEEINSWVELNGEGTLMLYLIRITQAFIYDSYSSKIYFSFRTAQAFICNSGGLKDSSWIIFSFRTTEAFFFFSFRAAQEFLFRTAHFLIRTTQEFISYSEHIKNPFLVPDSSEFHIQESSRSNSLFGAAPAFISYSGHLKHSFFIQVSSKIYFSFRTGQAFISHSGQHKDSVLIRDTSGLSFIFRTAKELISLYGRLEQYNHLDLILSKLLLIVNVFIIELEYYLTNVSKIIHKNG